MASLCYMKDSYRQLEEQPLDRHKSRGEMVKASGHHSTYCHSYRTIVLSGIPKIICMTLNSLTFYNTSEKSGRYTVMDKVSPIEKELYDKWRSIIKQEVLNKYGDRLSDADADKRGKENARKFTSVFTPSVMAYTTSVQQWNYIVDWCEKYHSPVDNSYFYNEYEKYIKELGKAIKPLVEVKGLHDNKDRGFGAFITTNMETPAEHFGDIYNTSYLASFDEMAQCERHRVSDIVLYIEGPIPNNFSVPAILSSAQKEEWLEDMKKVAHLFPTGMLVLSEEKGTFVGWAKSKCMERDCGQAQYEIMKRNDWLHDRFLENLSNLTHEEQSLLLAMDKRVRCSYPNFKCTSPCPWGSKLAKERLI